MLQSQRDFNRASGKHLPINKPDIIVNAFGCDPAIASKHQDAIAKLMHKHEGEEGRRRIAVMNEKLKGAQDNRRMKLAPRRAVVYQAIQEAGQLYTTDLLELININADTLRSDLNALVQVDVVKKIVADNRASPTLWKALVDDLQEARSRIERTVTANVSYAQGGADQKAVIEYLKGRDWTIARDIAKHIQSNSSRQVSNTLMGLRADGIVESKRAKSHSLWRMLDEPRAPIQRTDIGDRILDLMEPGMWYKSPEIAKAVGRHITNVQTAMNRLKRKGIVQWKVSPHNKSHKIWSRT
jgi:predicted transcriptional regulator